MFTPRANNSRRRITTRIAALGAAGAAAALFAAPTAFADDTPPTDTTSDTATPPPVDPGTPTDSGTQSSTPPASSSSSAPSGGGGKTANGIPKAPKAQAAITPNFGNQKIRSGISLKDGSWFPPGASLAGANIFAVETDPDGGFVDSGNCETIADGSCPFFWFPDPGDTVTFIQTTAPDGPGVGIDPNPNVIGPCVNPVEVLTGTAPQAKPAVAEEFPICAQGPDIPLTKFTPGFHSTSQVRAATGVTPQVVGHDVFGPFALFIDPPLPPLAADDMGVVHLGDSITIPVLDNDTTFGAPTDVISVTQPGHGTAQIVGDEVKYTPTAPTGGPDTFSYTLQTPNGTASAVVHITVLAPPLAVDDSATTLGGVDGHKGHPVTINVLANDNAEGAPPLVLASATAPSHGGISFTADDQITYTPDANFAGIDTFTYTITTENGEDTATVTVNVVAPPAALAETGALSGTMTTYGLLLLIGGGGAVWAGRRKYQRSH